MNVPQLTADRISQLVRRLNRPENFSKYWQVTKPSRVLTFSNAPRYVEKTYPNAQGANRFVYWPDYKVAGTISDIVNTFQNAGINQVHVGTLYSMSNGQIGCPPGILPLSEQVVANCAFDSLNPDHTELLLALANLDLRHTLGNMQQKQYNQLIGEQQNIRQQIGEEFLYAPPNAFQAYPQFQGGQNFLTAQQRNVGQYGIGF